MRIAAVLFGLLLLAISWFFATRMPFPDAPTRAAITEGITYEEVDDLSFFYHVNHAEGEHSPPVVILVPSAGRVASDFNELVETLNNVGYETWALDLPTLTGPTLETHPHMEGFAAPVVRMMKKNAIDPERKVVLIGHAFGNRVVRMAAHLHPESVNAVILLAAGGQKAIEPTANQALLNCFDPLRSYKSRMRDVAYAFFADGNPISDHWRRGWHTQAAMLQGRAVKNTTSTDWQAAGGRPILIVQPSEDRIAPKEDTADILQVRYPDQVSVTVIENAGHALLPEQPHAVAEAVINYLNIYHPIEERL